MSVAKVVVVIVWLLFLSCFFVDTTSTVSFVGRLGFWLMAITHVVECAVFLPRLRSSPGFLVGHLLRTLLFGFLHVREVRGLTTQEETRS
jgi:uncharacterized protein YhhL (DUF1145 family)